MMLRLILIVLTGVALSGCSLFSKSKEEIPEYAPKIVNTVPPPRPIRREPGSLWSPDSKWNEMYAQGPSRFPGDILTIKMNDGLRGRIQAITNPSSKEGSEGKKADAKGEEKEEKSQGDSGTGSPSTQANKNESKTVEATILEVLPRGMYKISANRGIQVGNKTPYVALEANVREREIQPDDTISSDALLNLKLDVISLNESRERQAEGK